MILRLSCHRQGATGVFESLLPVSQLRVVQPHHSECPCLFEQVVSGPPTRQGHFEIRQRFEQRLAGRGSGTRSRLAVGAGRGDQALVAVCCRLHFTQGDTVAPPWRRLIWRGDAKPVVARRFRNQLGDLAISQRMAVGCKDFVAGRAETLHREIDAALIHQQPCVLTGLQCEQIFVRLPAAEFTLQRLSRFQQCRWSVRLAIDACGGEQDQCKRPQRTNS